MVPGRPPGTGGVLQRRPWHVVRRHGAGMAPALSGLVGLLVRQVLAYVLLLAAIAAALQASIVAEPQ